MFILAIINRLKLSEVQKILDYDSQASAEKWCKNHGIPILIEGKGKHVHEPLVARILDKPFIDQLKEENPNNYKEVYEYVKKHNCLPPTDSNRPDFGLNDSKLSDDSKNFLNELLNGE